jgi:hypothetical protein
VVAAGGRVSGWASSPTPKTLMSDNLVETGTAFAI